MGELSDSVLDDRTMAKSGSLPPSCYQVDLPIQEVILHRQLDEEIIEDCQDVDSNKGEDEYDSDESELDPQDDSDHHVSTDTPELTREVFFLIGSRSRFGRAVRFNGRFVQ